MILCFINIDGKEVDHAELVGIPSHGDIITTKLGNEYCVNNVIFKEDSEEITANVQRLNRQFFN